MSLLSAADVASPVFYVPDELAYNTTYSYRLKVSAARARSKTVDVRVKVLDNPNIVVACPDSPYEVYEGSEDFDLECFCVGGSRGFRLRLRMDGCQEQDEHGSFVGGGRCFADVPRAR